MDENTDRKSAEPYEVLIPSNVQRINDDRGIAKSRIGDSTK